MAKPLTILTQARKNSCSDFSALRAIVMTLWHLSERKSKSGMVLARSGTLNVTAPLKPKPNFQQL